MTMKTKQTKFTCPCIMGMKRCVKVYYMYWTGHFLLCLSPIPIPMSWTHLDLPHGPFHSPSAPFLQTRPPIHTAQGHAPALGLRQDALKQTESY